MVALLLAALLVTMAILLLPYVFMACVWLLVIPCRVVTSTISSSLGEVASQLEELRTRAANRHRLAGVQKKVRKIRSQHFHSAGLLRRKDPRNEASTILLRNVTKDCCRILQYAGAMYNVSYLGELAGHEVWETYREQVLDSLDLAAQETRIVDELKEASVAMKLMTLDVVRHTCEHCPMLGYTREEAPQLCDPAKAFGNQEA